MFKFHKTTAQMYKTCDHLVYIAPRSLFKKKTHNKVMSEELLSPFSSVLKESLAKKDNSSKSQSFTSFTGKNKPTQITLILLADQVSRYNCKAQKEAIYKHTTAIKGCTNPGFIISLNDEEDAIAAITAISRHQRPYSRKSGEPKKKAIFHFAATNAKGEMISTSKMVQALPEGIALTCSIIDTAPSDMGPATLSTLIKKRFSKKANVKVTEISGKNLLKAGLGGVYSVGKTATEDPRLVILDYKPTGYKKTVAIVGKGVTYDCGGLSLKIQGSMVGMKTDLSGAASAIGAFDTIINTKCKNRVIVAVSLAENAIGPESYKNDDILTLHSGKTVEINNTDAEGRLVLADAVSFVCRKYKPSCVVDIATLTGAQLVATGLLHAGLVSSDESMERYLFEIGKKTGDLVSPLPFAPEIFQEEFSSEVADMRNSVKNRMNAQSSCAAQFIYEHISDLDIPWAHIDMAGPATSSNGLGSGYGVALLSQLAHNPKF